MHTKRERLAPFHLELEPSFEYEKELVFVLVAVPVDELALDHSKPDDAIVHARERLIHLRLMEVHGSEASVRGHDERQASWSFLFDEADVATWLQQCPGDADDRA